MAIKKQTQASAPLPPPPSFFEKAEHIVNGPRQDEYGYKLTNFSQISMIWQGMLAHKLQPDAAITPEDVALLMIGVKAARLAKSPDHFDSWIDIAGYAGCASILQDERADGMPLPGAIKDPREGQF